MSKFIDFISHVKLNLDRLFGTHKYVCYTYIFISLIFYYILLFPTIGFDLNKIFLIYKSDIATISGILIGLLSTSFGIVISSKNPIIDILKGSDNIKVIYKISFSSISSFILCLLIYVMKIFYVSDIDNVIIYTGVLNINLFILILHVGMFSFIYALILLLVNLYYLKRIFLQTK